MTMAVGTARQLVIPVIVILALGVLTWKKLLKEGKILYGH